MSRGAHIANASLVLPQHAQPRRVPGTPASVHFSAACRTTKCYSTCSAAVTKFRSKVLTLVEHCLGGWQRADNSGRVVALVGGNGNSKSTTGNLRSLFHKSIPEKAEDLIKG
jgi:hypothetical protein